MAAGQPATRVTTIVPRLNAPRGITFDAQGSMYVAQSGRFLGTVGPSGATGEGVTTTGSVSRYRRPTRSPSLVWRTRLQSVFDVEEGNPEVLGPEGLSITGTCARGRAARRTTAGGCKVLTIMSLSRAGFAKTHPGAPVPPQLGQLLDLNQRTGAVRRSLGNVGDQQYAFTAQHPELDPGGQFPDANPYGVLATGRHVYVIDAGANTVSEVRRNGTTRILAYTPNDPVSDSTPTCAARGPDGALYVGTLNLLFNSVLTTMPPGIGLNPGHSDVWRIDPRTTEDPLHAAHRWATGLTTVTACTFDRRGNFWATEMFQPNGSAPPGDLARIAFRDPATIQRVGGGSLPLPGGVAQGPDGNLYVTTGSADVRPDAGAVVRVSLGR